MSTPYVWCGVQVASTGTWLRTEGELYVAVSLLGLRKRTSLSEAVFPLCFHERFRFDKVCYTLLCYSATPSLHAIAQLFIVSHLLFCFSLL